MKMDKGVSASGGFDPWHPSGALSVNHSPWCPVWQILDPPCS